uniref:SAP domain-containing protein n=1 Tax=Heterosigma akashiwo TaxID=2829 RepID=A0A7S3Y7V4_HETAK
MVNVVELFRSEDSEITDPYFFARFAIGVTSPKITRKKWHHHEEFGCCKELSFRAALDLALSISNDQQSNPSFEMEKKDSLPKEAIRDCDHMEKQQLEEISNAQQSYPSFEMEKKDSHPKEAIIDRDHMEKQQLEEISSNEIDAMRVVDLKIELRKRNLKVGGNKLELQERLKKYNI